MKQPTPIELLEKEIESDRRAMIKSINGLIDGRISIESHLKHAENLIPRITQFVEALKKLK